SDGASPTSSVSGDPATTTPTTTGASDGQTGPTDGGTASESATGTTTAPTTAGTDTAGSTSDTDGGVGLCGDDPPKGFDGPFDANCKTEPAVGTFTPVIEWHKDTWAAVPAGPHSASAPIVVQLSDDDADGMITEDDIPDIVFVSYGDNGGVLRAISGDGSK